LLPACATGALAAPNGTWTDPSTPNGPRDSYGTRSAWSRFIASLLARNPEYVRRIAAEVVGFFDPDNKEVNERYRAIRQPDDPETYGGT
jgi:hypothetical protein